MRHVLLSLGLAACAATPAPVMAPQTRGRLIPDAPPPSTSCAALRVGQPSPLTMSSRLAAIAPQYFHPGSRTGWNDLVAGTSRYQWFDADAREAPIDPPRGMDIIVRTTRSLLIGYDAVAARGAPDASPTGIRMRVVDALETAAGDAFVAGIDAGKVHIAHVDAKGSQSAFTIAAPNIVREELRLVEVQGRVAAAWAEHVPGSDTLEIHGAWVGTSKRDVLDSVSLDPDVADLSARTGVELSLATHGGSLAFAWRVLAVPRGTKVEDRLAIEASAVPFPAEVRTRVGSGPVTHHATAAQPLGFTTGIGPWGLYPSGLVAVPLPAPAFAWIEGKDVVVALAGEPLAAPVHAAGGAPLIVGRRDAVWLFFSTGSAVAVPLTCAP